jgi:hypothetical protein
MGPVRWRWAATEFPANREKSREFFLFFDFAPKASLKTM